MKHGEESAVLDEGWHQGYAWASAHTLSDVHEVESSLMTVQAFVLATFPWLENTEHWFSLLPKTVWRTKSPIIPTQACIGNVWRRSKMDCIPKHK